MKRYIGLVFIILAAGGCSSDKATVNGGPDSGPSEEGGAGSDTGAPAAVHRIDRSHLSNTGTTTPFDYGDPALWLCQPGNDPNECSRSLDTTEFLKDGTQQVDKHTAAKNPAFDCFYVYPTVDLTGDGNMTNFADISLTLDPLLAQAARFTRLCEVYAPVYRQNALSIGSAAGDGGGVTRTGNPTIGYQDVEAAFGYYMDHYNKGRKFVLMGHSQGTFMLTQLMVNKFDNDSALRGKLISALLIGGAISVPEGKDVGDTFKNIPLCTKQAQTGCVIAYNSFAKDAPPPSNSLFGAPRAPGMMDACTNPSLLAGNTGRYKGSYSPTHFYDPVFAPDTPMNTYPTVTTAFTMVRDFFSGECKNQNGYSYLEIRPDPAADDERQIPPYRVASSESLGFGMHIADFSIEQDDLIDAVDQQAKAALGK